jgi:5'(3')-deoxyribonucleotidase
VVQGTHREEGERLTVGIDLDGVLADQLAGAFPRIKERLGIDLAWNDVTEFRLPLGETDLAREIELAQLDPAYLLEMPVHSGALALVDELRLHYRVVLITARPGSALELTSAWLDARGFKFEAIIPATEEKKSVYGADVLIDDYTGNIRDFLANTDGLGVLVDRPWNRTDRSTISAHPDHFAVAETFAAIPALITSFARRYRRAPGVTGSSPAD